MRVNSEIIPPVLNCSTVEAIWDNATHTDAIDTNYSRFECDGGIRPPAYTPTPKPTAEPKTPVSQSLAIGLGVGIPCLFGIMLTIYLCMRSAKRAAAREDAQPPKYEMEPLPEYSPRRSEETQTQPGDERSVEAGVGQGDRSTDRQIGRAHV